MPFIPPNHFDASSFSFFKNSMMQQEDFPLSEVLDEAFFQQAFEEHRIDFANDDDAVYTPAITLWALLSQVLFDTEQRSCKAAVARVASLWVALGRRDCSTNTGAYCRARQKIPAELLRTLTKQMADNAQAELTEPDLLTHDQAELQQSPSVLAEVKATARSGRLLLVDGFTVTAADTPQNQAEYPQNPAQKEGLGFPVIRCVSLISLETGLLVDLACGSYLGKGSGEPALLRQLLDTLESEDILVADSYYCSYWLLAECHCRDVEVVMRNHHLRSNQPEDAIELDDGQRYVCWERPQRPEWMSQEEYEQVPEELLIRLVDVTVARDGFRPQQFSVATTLLHLTRSPASWIRAVYASRWFVELDIRSIKCSLKMDILRAKKPAMVRTELWSCLLVYNLIRLKMLQSSVEEGRDPRSLSFTTTQQLIATNWLLCAVIGVSAEHAKLGQKMPCSERVGHREGRVEPRENKRRPKILALMTRPRAVRKAELASAA